MITLNDLCLGNKKQKILFEFYGIYSGFIGKVFSNMNELESIKFSDKKLEIKADDGTVKGYMQIKFQVEEVSRFIDLVEKGLQISLTVAIDYTKSNGDPEDEDSLHHIKEKSMNP
ncbi:MAG: hypothetical protein MJ252_13945 [archaeon]|nr:hypothetical protein [archaeon]